MLKITPNHKIIKNYYRELQSFERANQTQEDTVKQAFQHILEAYAKPRKWTLIQEQTIQAIRLDGTLFDESQIPRGYWEAKRDSVKLEPAIQEKLYDKGYPQDNIVFQKPSHAILIQNGDVALDVSLAKPENLIEVVDKFFNFKFKSIARKQNTTGSHKWHGEKTCWKIRRNYFKSGSQFLPGKQHEKQN